MINQQPNKCYFLQCQCWHVPFVIQNFWFFRIFHLDLKIVWLWLHFIIWNDIWICFWSKLIYACKTFEMFSLFNLKCWSNELCMRRRRDNQIKSHCKWSSKQNCNNNRIWPGSQRHSMQPRRGFHKLLKNVKIQLLLCDTSMVQSGTT